FALLPFCFPGRFAETQATDHRYSDSELRRRGNIATVCGFECRVHPKTKLINTKKQVFARSRIATAIAIASVLAAGLVAQQKPAWIGWSEKDAEKILNNSPWGQTQTDTNTSEMVYSPTNGGTSGLPTNRSARTTSMRDEQADRNRNRAAEGAYNQAVTIN